MSKKHFRPTKDARPDDNYDQVEDYGYNIKNMKRSSKRRIAKFKDYRDDYGDS